MASIEKVAITESGQMIPLMVGGEVTLTYLVQNSMGDIASFQWEVESLPEGITVTEAPKQIIGISGEEVVSLSLQASRDLVAGTYSLGLQLLCDNTPEGTKLSASLYVSDPPENFATEAQASHEEIPVKEEPDTLASPPPSETRNETATATPSRGEAKVSGSVPITKPKPKEAAGGGKKATIEPEVVNFPTGKQPANTLGTNSTTVPKVTRFIPKDWKEPNMLDGSGEASIPMRPGDTMLFRFTVSNQVEPKQQRTYQLVADDKIPRNWLTFEKQTHSMGYGMNNELSVRVRLPLDVVPGEHFLEFKVGEQFGKQKDYLYRLIVKATPSVRLIAKQTEVKAGPFPPPALSLPLTMTVEKSGNADTAFRLMVLPSALGKELLDNGGKLTAPRKDLRPIEEEGNFRFVLDRELDELVSPGYNQPPPPQSFRFQFERKPGWWWWGRLETQTAYVQAVPVTDPTNGGRGDNLVKLTATRTRLLPFPAVLLLPLLLLVPVFFGGQPNSLEVIDPTYVGTDGIPYVVSEPTEISQSVSATAKLKWNAPWFVPMRLTAGNETLKFPAGSPSEAAYPIPNEKYFSSPEVRVSNLSGGEDHIIIQYVKALRDTKVGVFKSNSESRSEIEIGSQGVFTLPIRPDKIGYLLIKNKSNVSVTCQIIRAELPSTDSGFIVNNLNKEFTLPQGVGQLAKIKYSGTGSGTGKIVLITSDPNQKKMEINLRLENQ